VTQSTITKWTGSSVLALPKTHQTAQSSPSAKDHGSLLQQHHAREPTHNSPTLVAISTQPPTITIEYAAGTALALALALPMSSLRLMMPRKQCQLQQTHLCLCTTLSRLIGMLLLTDLPPGMIQSSTTESSGITISTATISMQLTQTISHHGSI